MEKFELSIPYPAVSKRFAATFCAVWGLIGLFCLLFIAGFLCDMGTALHLPSTLSAIVGILSGCMLYLFFCFIAFRVTIARWQPSPLFLTREGIGLPQQFLGLRGPRFYPWSKLASIKMERNLAGDIIVFQPHHDLAVRLSLKPLSKPTLEQLLLGIEVMGKDVAWHPALIEYRDKLQNENRGIEGGNYTKFWQEELARQFRPVTFSTLEPGKTLRSQTLKITRQLAFGGFSAVYLAEDTVLGKVVIKELVAPAGAVDKAQKKAAELFEREARLLSKLNHPRIVKVLDHFQEDGRCYMVLEHIEGENLRRLVSKKGQLSEQSVLVLALEMAEILSYLHGLVPPLIHKDFTPDNLVLRKDGELMVVDFGAANEFLGCATGTLVGKQCYMPPEQVKGKAQPASDIFAMGATLYFLLTGHDPQALTVSKPRSKAKVSEDLDQLISRMTALELSERNIDAKGVLAEVERIAEVHGHFISLEKSINA